MFRQAALRRITVAPGAPTPLRVHVPRRLLFSPRSTRRSGRAVENNLDIRRMSKQSEEWHRNRRTFLWFHNDGGAARSWRPGTARSRPFPAPSTSQPSHAPIKLPYPTTQTDTLTPSSHHPLRATQQSTPLWRLGLRTVTFVNLQVYVVGYYVATADIAALQSALTKKINPIATTLVASEREELRGALLDPFVRAVQARATPETAADDAFGEAMRQFRAVFNRGSVPKRKELLLVRDETGRMSISYDAGANKKEGRPAGRQLIGVVEDERVSRALWLNYLAGKKVASEPARKNIVEGIMEFVERPIGTVAAQVVPVVNSRV
ncbi:hypothetical protein CHGG_07436 [Chaetomium globosum CBS 148.51]|uniref:Chalcone isomerase domain-containing protein n=1 Tax=Chaetomium globosum (strain ATCC 6205 / CBS 148.51 / DSM 1962 / NBRC 6347 / NRRL 1970) TaxID=306901 RepID=Q2GX68_CHAGB|nr:uncharacterized protein CHGG_07436 [Chaetomium globosum CBS 148.51]EAQ86183.1 hypothetical protein CHGG_07436 [Chaetomium globosum CBS 148.51]